MSESDGKDGGPAAPETLLTSEQLPESAHLSSEEEIGRLREQLRAAEEETRRQHDRYLRERADAENFKKRLQREKAEALRFACEPLIRELLPVVDNLERALAHDEGASIRDGVRIVLEALVGVLSAHGVRRVDAVGHPFDPAKHQALAQVDSPETPPNYVVEQHHSGYFLHDRLLRPALVSVSGRKQAAPGHDTRTVESDETNG
jgi:molecular chaperone GrpE